jgi:hypothetical protein
MNVTNKPSQYETISCNLARIFDSDSDKSVSYSQSDKHKREQEMEKDREMEKYISMA